PLAKGDMLGAFALTEPQVGSDAAAIITRAERKEGHYVLNGVKQFITSGKSADIAVVFAVTDKGAGKKGISAFLVPTKTPGYVVARIEDKTGQRASDTAQIAFENCRVPADHLLAQEGVGYRIALANLESGIREASMAKLFASEMAEKVGSDAIQIHGGYGYVADFPVERLWRDVRVTQIYEGASDIQRMVIGRTLEQG